MHAPTRLPASGLRPILTILLLADGLLHLSLAPEHFAESPLFGAGFLLAGALQIVIAAWLTLKRSTPAYAAATAISVVLVAAYAVHVTSGIPTGGTSAHTHGAKVASAEALEALPHHHGPVIESVVPAVAPPVNPGISVEPISVTGIVSKALEIATIMGALAAIAMLRQRQISRRRVPAAVSKVGLTGLLMLMLAACSSPTGAAPAAASVAKNQQAVEIKQFMFAPGSISVPVGTTITWSNHDAIIHSVTSGKEGAPLGAFDSGFFDEGKTYSFTFATAGNYPYFCMRHTFMNGSVTVTP